MHTAGLAVAAVIYTKAIDSRVSPRLQDHGRLEIPL